MWPLHERNESTVSEPIIYEEEETTSTNLPFTVNKVTSELRTNESFEGFSRSANCHQKAQAAIERPPGHNLKIQLGLITGSIELLHLNSGMLLLKLMLTES
eukprot:TCONS_00033213-protein